MEGLVQLPASKLNLPELGSSEVLVFGEHSEANNFWVWLILSRESSAVNDVLVDLHLKTWVAGDFLWHLKRFYN